MYIKRHPVPFAEYIPLRGIAEAVSSAAKLVHPGHGGRAPATGCSRGGPVPIGDVICFEVAYDDLVRSSVAAGAQLLVVQTNNATFGHTAETYQQLAMSRLRAVETGRTVRAGRDDRRVGDHRPGRRDPRASPAPLFAPAHARPQRPGRGPRTTLAVALGAVPEYCWLARRRWRWLAVRGRRSPVGRRAAASDGDSEGDGHAVSEFDRAARCS